MKTFFNLVQEVQKPGLCYRCGGCVTFCTAINYGALEIDLKGKPVYGDMEKCIECGLCYSICPQINELDQQTKDQAAWTEPLGRVIETTVVRSKDPLVLSRAAEGGAVTSLLLHLFDRNRIDGAIITRSVGKYQRQPFLATAREEIYRAAGMLWSASQEMKNFKDQYMTFTSVQEFDAMIKQDLKRVAFVGTPCQIKSLRKMQVLNLVPSDAIKFCFGLFCSGNFTFGEKEQAQLADRAGIAWEDVARINLKDKLIITLNSGEIRTVDLEEMDSMKHYACHYCSDYSAEFADISFGGIGAPQGWTTLITRTPLGRAVLADSRSFRQIEQFDIQNDPGFATNALQAVRQASALKKKRARLKRRELTHPSLQIRI